MPAPKRPNKVIMVMYDSLNRRMLSPYGCNWVQTPNFQRLAQRAVTFDNAYVGSMPCMPARRELHTGRYNFLHRSWGPLEPFDDSMPEILKKNGVYSHLVSDHGHYWEDGGCTYHTRYSSWEINRGQEGDPWKGQVRYPDVPTNVVAGRDRNNPHWRQDWVNRTYLREEKRHPQARTFAQGMEFIRTNANAENWFLQIETFDPHEPYFSYEQYRKLYAHFRQADIHFDWPPYRALQETPEQVAHVRAESAALHTMCDAYLGKVLDLMDELRLWDDTMLIVNTDHGFLLGEHDYWAKCHMPFYQEVAHMPLFMWDPRGRRAGEHSAQLVQSIDLAPTILDFFNLPLPPHMQGRPLTGQYPARPGALYGIHGGQVNVTDGRYVYMRAPIRPDNSPLYNYTLMPTHMRGFFNADELAGAELAAPFSFTRGYRTLRTPTKAWTNPHEFGTRLYDLQNDPGQERPIHDPAVEKRMIHLLVELMKWNDAPLEQFERLGLSV
jgi:arylsulfatase A-like enzyme